MTSSSKDRGRDDCQIHVDKEGESCVIKIESVGQEKILKELLSRFNSLKTEVNQLLSNQQPKEMMDAIQDITTKLKPLEEQLQKVNKHVGDDHIQLNKIQTDINKKFDEIKQDLNSFKEQQKNLGSSKDTIDKISQKLDNLDKILRNSHDEGQKRLSTDLQNLKQQIPSKPDFKPILDAIQTLQTSFDKEKTKPDILARKLDSIDQKLKEPHPEHMAVIKDIQTKLDPLHKQTSETLTKINDRVKALHTDASKSHPDIIQKLDQIDQQFKTQQNSLIEPIKQILNPFIEQQTKKDGDNDSDSPNRVPLCINGIIPDPHVLQALAGDIAKKLTDIQTKLSSSEDLKRKQNDQELLKNIDSKLNHLSQNIDKENGRSDTQPDFAKEISTRTQPLQQALDHLSKQQQPLIDIIRELPKKLDDIRQSQSSSNLIKEFSSKLDPLTQSIKAIKDGLDKQTLTDPQKQSDHNQDIEKALQPFSHIIKTLKDSIEQSQAQQQSETKKFDNLEQRISKSFDTTPKPSDIMGKLNEITTNFKQTDPTIKKLSDDLNTIKTLIEKQTTPALHQASKDSLDLKKTNNEIVNKIDKLDEQLTHLNHHLPAMDDLPKQIGLLKDAFEKFKQNESSQAIKDINDRLKNLDETLKELPDQLSLKSKHSVHDDDDRMNTANPRQVPLSQSIPQDSNNLMTISDGQTANLFTNLLTLQTAIQNSDHIPYQDIQQYLKRIEQSTLVQTDRDLQGLVQHVKDLCVNNNTTNTQSPESNKNNSLTPIQQYSEINQSENRRNKLSLPSGYLTKSRYISLLSDQIIRENWPKLSQRSIPIIESIVNQPLEFDNGTNLDRLIKQNGLEQYASLTRNAIEKSDKDYDKISYMMDSIVFDQMTMIGSREALIRPWDPSLLNRASSKGFYPYPSDNARAIERFQVNKNISLWMVETDENKPYEPNEFLPNLERLYEKYERIQHPHFPEIRQKRREDETRWNERYAFTKEQRRILFVNDLRSYFMDYDTKRKYQVHDDVPINPVCRTGIAGRGDLPFWGPNHCVVVVLLRNINDPEVVLMKHHGNALVLPKGFYGHEARYDNQIKIIQDPVSGQILPPNLLDYWWMNVIKLNEMNSSITNLKRVLNEKELKEEFAEIFSQKGCNKSVFDNGYVDHPLNTDHAWVESSVWKIQFKDWRIPEMKSAKYAIADDLKTNNTSPFVWMKLTDAILIVPPFDRGILVDVLATGMPL